MMMFLSALLLFSALLASPVLRIEASLNKFGRAFLVSAFGVVLPLAAFFLSVFLVPDWKGACTFGWIDCFHMGKLALTPFVLWATYSLYVVELFPKWARPQRAIALGLFMGGIIAGICFLFGIFTIGKAGHFIMWILVPLYISFWQTWHALHLMKEQGWKRIPYFLTLLVSLPFWIGSALWSRRVYEKLPDQPPECFVVTAASRGHGQLVGPFIEIVRHNRALSANPQLLRFWEFEKVWTKIAPRSHRLFRSFYNRWAPMLARRVISPWTADAVYLALKPIEFAAGLLVALSKTNLTSTNWSKRNEL